MLGSEWIPDSNNMSHLVKRTTEVLRKPLAMAAKQPGSYISIKYNTNTNTVISAHLQQAIHSLNLVLIVNKTVHK